MGEISIVNTVVLGTLQIGTIIVKQEIPLFIQNNTYFLTLIELKIALIISKFCYPNILNILYSAWIIEV